MAATQIGVEFETGMTKTILRYEPQLPTGFHTVGKHERADARKAKTRRS
jgi:hypothetical protein